MRLKDIIRELRLRQSFIPPRYAQHLFCCSTQKSVLEVTVPYLKRAFAESLIL